MPFNSETTENNGSTANTPSEDAYAGMFCILFFHLLNPLPVITPLLLLLLLLLSFLQQV